MILMRRGALVTCEGDCENDFFLKWFLNVYINIIKLI
jgi:hypothetical protein